jgi:hypothetical protein
MGHLQTVILSSNTLSPGSISLRGGPTSIPKHSPQVLPEFEMPPLRRDVERLVCEPRPEFAEFQDQKSHRIGDAACCAGGRENQ